MRVLLVEDSQHLAPELRLRITKHGHSLDTKRRLNLGDLKTYDIIMLDAALYSPSLGDAVRRLGRRGHHVKLIRIGAGMGRRPSIKGSYVDFPSLLPVWKLAALVVALSRRQKRSRGTLFCHPLRLNFDTQAIEVNESRVSLTEKECGLLELLLIEPGNTVTRRQIAAFFYGSGDTNRQVVATYMARLRKKLAQVLAGEDCIICSNEGYKLNLSSWNMNALAPCERLAA